MMRTVLVLGLVGAACGGETNPAAGGLDVDQLLADLQMPSCVVDGREDAEAVSIAFARAGIPPHGFCLTFNGCCPCEGGGEICKETTSTADTSFTRIVWNTCCAQSPSGRACCYDGEAVGQHPVPTVYPFCNSWQVDRVCGADAGHIDRQECTWGTDGWNQAGVRIEGRDGTCMVSGGYYASATSPSGLWEIHHRGGVWRCDLRDGSVTCMQSGATITWPWVFAE
jgi:hypothetical protein